MTRPPRTGRGAPDENPDAAALSRASRTVGVQIALASSVIVVLAVVAAFAFVFIHIHQPRVIEPHDRESTIDVGAFDILVAAIVIGIVGIVIAGLLSWFVTRRAVRPLGEALRVQRSFVADASHELRTPLAVLGARLQALQRRMAPDDPATETVVELRRDAGTLVQIVNDLLAAAEEGGAPSPGEVVDAEPVARLAVDSMDILAAERGVAIELHATSVGVVVPAASVHRCIVALLDNALRYAPRGSTISVVLSAERSVAELRVTDAGPGITGIEPARVFDRFARGASGDARSDGFGIGLALVRDSLRRYGGDAAVESTGPQGTTMLLRMPRARRR